MATVRGDEADLFARLHGWLREAVTSYTSAPEHLVEEACSWAWHQLLSHQPPRERVEGWLWRTALREAWRLEAVEERQRGYAEPRAEACTPIETRQRWLEALGALTALRPRQRRLLGLQAGGRDYHEISAVTGDSWRTVDRQLVRARKRLAAA